MARAPADASPLRVIFFGTPDFALPSLRALVKSRHEVVGVITQPDRPRGRGRKLGPPPVASLAAELGLPVRQPVKVGEQDVLEWMRGLRADLGVVVAFGQFIPKSVRELPVHGLINAHASLLPRWRGAAPIQWAILEGDRTTGVSVMRLVKEMDAGDVCLVRETEIREGETAGQLEPRLADLAAEALLAALEEIAAGQAVFRPQNPDGVTEAPKINREFAQLDWSEPVERVLRRIRASSPRPGADLVLGRAGVRQRILQARRLDLDLPPKPGGVRAVEGRLCVSAADGWIEVLRLQAPGKGPVSAAEVLRSMDIASDEEVPVR